jgi:membrane peptidoglycan carboxypeptidase
LASISAGCVTPRYKQQSQFNKGTHLGLSFGSSITAFFNGQLYHTPAIALKTAAAVVLSEATDRTFDDLVVSNWPQKQTAYQASKAGKKLSAKSELWGSLNLFAQAIFTALLVFR